MILSEIHLIAEIFGAAFLVVSASIIIFELHQNLKQRKIHNTFMRSVEVEKIFHREMEKEFSILLCKAKKNYRSLEDFERQQFHSYIHLVTSVLNRSGLMAAESSFLQGKKITERRLRTGIKILFSDPGMRDAYLFLRELGTLDGYDKFHSVFDDLDFSR